MKKKVVLGVFLLLILFTLVACGNKELKVDNSISFTQLKKIAIEKAEFKPDNYNIHGELFKIDYTSSYIPCLGSNLSSKVYIDGTITLKNFDTDEVICEKLGSSGLNSSYTTFKRTGLTYTNDSLPVAIYSLYDTTKSLYIINYIDPYGKQLKQEYVANGKLLGEIDKIVIGDYTYFYILRADNESQNVYFRYKYENYKYVVESISSDDYEKAVASTVANEYQDGLTAIYSTKGKIVAYIYRQGDSYFIYNSKKQYLNNIDIDSLGFSSPNVVLRLEKKLCFFKNEVYYENELDKGSKDKYKCRYLEIDLSTGKISYNDKFKYYVTSGYTKLTDGVFNCSYILYYDLNDKGERDNTLKCVFLTRKMTFSDAFVYDGFTKQTYLVDKDTILAYYNSGLFVVNKKGKTLLNDINIVSLLDNGEVVYRNQNGKYYQCKLKDISRSIKNLDNGLYYTSKETFNGKTISYGFDEETGKYFKGDLVLNKKFLNYANKGIYITEKEVYVDDKKIISLTDATINNVDVYTSIGESTIYRLYLSDDSTKFIRYISFLE